MSYLDTNLNKAIKDAINKVMEDLKTSPANFMASFDDGTVILFDKYEEAISFYTSHPFCTLRVV